jgi:hypothetical protein
VADNVSSTAIGGQADQSCGVCAFGHGAAPRLHLTVISSIQNNRLPTQEVYLPELELDVPAANVPTLEGG